MPFFDFHIHPTLKSLFSVDDQARGLQKLSPWVAIDRHRVPFLLKCCTEFEYIIQSQSNLLQLADSHCALVCVALYIPEKDMLTDDLIQGGTSGPLGVYLQKDKIDSIINGNPYQLLRTDDWSTLTDAAQFGIVNKKVKPIMKRSDFDETDVSTIHAIFSVEGCHTLSSALQHFDVNEIIANLDDLRSKVALVSVNITHMEQSPLCNHAFGMQFLSNEGFRPTQSRISNGGFMILKHCYENNIMIDIKHMSIGARKHLYEIRKTPEFAGINQPIVCTHAGFTGISMNEIPDYVFATRKFNGKGYTVVWQGKPIKYGNAPRPSFNASSINLYDEDIMEILNSDGMIGFNIDKRILGYQQFEQETNGRDDFPLETEYVSNLEEADFFGAGSVEISNAFSDNKDLVMRWNEIEEGGLVNPRLSDYHLRHFMAHIIHVIVVARKNNYDASKALRQLCIGSDFDGLINPLWVCETATSLEDFKNAFKNNFEDFAHEAKVPLPAGFNITTFSNKLFYENGRDFILGRLDLLNP